MSFSKDNIKPILQMNLLLYSCNQSLKKYLFFQIHIFKQLEIWECAVKNEMQMKKILIPCHTSNNNAPFTFLI